MMCAGGFVWLSVCTDANSMAGTMIGRKVHIANTERVVSSRSLGRRLETLESHEDDAFSSSRLDYGDDRLLESRASPHGARLLLQSGDRFQNQTRTEVACS
jgi:hypothetical protein